ncbi:MAG: class I SAM-dependent methyltransferase [Desulfopila sp.]
MEYADEPRLIFTPLTENDYCDFYELEMGAFSDDAVFYSQRLPDNGKVLELGCGTGRLTRLLAAKCRHITGIDISAGMLDKAQQKPGADISYHQMDMTEISFAECFNAIIIPYNTLNMLGDPAKIQKCLALCRKHLCPAGSLLLQLYHPHPTTVAGKEKIFQFTILEDDSGGKIIKETLKSYDREHATLQLEERYRVRPAGGNPHNRDLRHCLSFYAPELTDWKKLLQAAGFCITESAGAYDGTPFAPQRDTTLLLAASPA